MGDSSPTGSSKGSQELFWLSLGPLESRWKEAVATVSRPTLKAFPTKPEERAANIYWPALPVSSHKGTNESPIQPGQKPIKTPSPTVTQASCKVNQKTPEDYKIYRVGRYGTYFQGNVILPISEVANVLESLSVSLVVFDIKNRRFVGLKKDSSEELLRTAGIQGQYFCRRSFAMWDLLLPTKEQTTKLAETYISKRFNRNT